MKTKKKIMSSPQKILSRINSNLEMLDCVKISNENEKKKIIIQLQQMHSQIFKIKSKLI